MSWVYSLKRDATEGGPVLYYDPEELYCTSSFCRSAADIPIGWSASVATSACQNRTPGR